MRYAHAFCIVLLCGAGFACVADDTGKACAGSAAPPSAVLAGGPTLLTQALVTRDIACLSLQCLTAAGLQPYCSRSCSLDLGKGSRCSKDGDCGRGQQCAGNRCVGDDCPAGFWCRVVQDAGPYSGQSFCARRPCQSRGDCEGGDVVCATVGCYADCQGDPNCLQPLKRCAAISELSCRCVDGSADCSDAQLQCQLPGAAAPLPVQAVTRRQLCAPAGQRL